MHLHHLFLLAVGGLAFAVSARRNPGWPVLALAAILSTLILYPVLFASDPHARHSGIAPSIPLMAAYTVVLLGIAYTLALRFLYRSHRTRSVPASVFIFLGFLVVGFTSIWQGTDEQLSGALQLSLGYCAWFVGGQLGPLIFDQVRRVRAIADTIAAIVGIETVVTLLQRAGVRINPMPPSLASIMGDRTNGTTNHPDNLGKVLFLLMVLCLGLMATGDARTRRTLWASIIVLFIPLGLSQGRADVLAALMAIVLWALLSGRRRSTAIRIGMPLLIVLIFLPFAGSIAQRVEEDPHGGPRAGLAATAIEQIHREPWGVGPNSYVSVVSAYNSVTAIGYPVHNTFLLTAAELGILGAILFWLPVVGFLAASWMSRKRQGFAGSFALAIVASAPGMYVINDTGWGILSGPLLPLWFLIYGLAYSQVGSPGHAILAKLTRSPIARSATRVGASDWRPSQAALPLRSTRASQ
jgi:O-Antigen ligase